MQVKGLIIAAGVILAAAAAVPVLAHHSFAAEFDINRPIQLDGTVTSLELSNPHSWLHLEVTLDTGEVQQWAVEGGAPNALMRRGFTKRTIPAGIEVHVQGYQARDGSTRASGRTITLANGEELFMGSVGIGAPPGEE